MSPKKPTPGFPDRFRVEVDSERVATAEELALPRPARVPREHRERSLRPSPETLSRLWAEARRWSPAGITAALLIVFFGIGGVDGVTKLVTALSDAATKNSELTAEVTATRNEVSALRSEMREFMANERAERSKVQARTMALEHNLSLTCDLISELNLGKPNATWCSADGRSIRFEPPPPNGARIPIHRTAAQWSAPDALSHVTKD